MKRFLMICFALFMVFQISFGVNASSGIENRIKSRYGKVRFISYSKRRQYDRILFHRKNKPYFVVEKISGKVINNRKDGKDTYGYYISYKGVRGAREGSQITTYLVYSRKNNYCDDIIKRYDTIVRR